MANIQQFNFAVNLLQVILWEYNEASALESLVNFKNDWYAVNQYQFWNNWYSNVFNLPTANLFGCAVWSIILGLPLFIDLNPDPPGKPIFGFNGNTGNGYQNFSNGNFTNAGGSIGLTLEEQRIVLRLRYFQLITRGAVLETNAMLKNIFGDEGLSYVVDNHDMTITYVFNFSLTSELREVIKTYDLLPRPSAVGIRYQMVAGPIFGFNGNTGNGYQNFSNGNYLPDF